MLSRRSVFFALLAMLAVVGSTRAQTPAKQDAPKKEPPAKQAPVDRDGKLREGDAAPDFTLKDMGGKTTVTLSMLKGKPVVLYFGSCT